MEIKTCEEYVVNRVLELENTNEQLNEVLTQTIKDNQQLQNKIDSFMSYFEILAPFITRDEDGRCVEFNSHWIWISDKDYDIFAELYEFLQDNFSQNKTDEGEDDS